MSQYGYIFEKLFCAVDALTGPGSQRDRLENAISAHFIAVLPDKHLPPEMRSEYEQFMDDMTSVDAKGDEGTLSATINTLDDMGVRVAVAKILSFFHTICRYEEPD